MRKIHSFNVQAGIDMAMCYEILPTVLVRHSKNQIVQSH